MSENTNIMETPELTPSQYFAAVKERKQHIEEEQLQRIYDNVLGLLGKYRVTGQVAAMKKLMFHLDCIERERQVVAAGIDTFVYRDDIEAYINDIASDVVKIIELSRYEREIPDEIVEIIAQTKDLFDELYVLFTDYTGQMERQVAKERRDKDPILFGVFKSDKDRVVIDRFYFLGDWVDEYCDLTLDKFVNETENAGRRNVTHPIRTPEDLDELKAQLEALTDDNNGSFRMTKKPHYKYGFFRKVRTFLSARKKASK